MYTCQADEQLARVPARGVPAASRQLPPLPQALPPRCYLASSGGAPHLQAAASPLVCACLATHRPPVPIPLSRRRGSAQVWQGLCPGGRPLLEGNQRVQGLHAQGRVLHMQQPLRPGGRPLLEGNQWVQGLHIQGRMLQVWRRAEAV